MFMFISLAVIIWLLIPAGVIIYFIFEAFARKRKTGIGLDETLPTSDLTGMVGVVTRNIVPGCVGQNSGQIRIGIKKHKAVAEKEIKTGKEVIVIHGEGITVTVEEKRKVLNKE